MARLALLVLPWLGACVHRPAPQLPRLTRTDAVIAASVAGATLAVMPFDVRITRTLRTSSLQGSAPLRSTSTAFRLLGDPLSLALSAGTYGVARLTHDATWTDIGWHATEAILASGAVTGAIKLGVGRARPYVSADSNAHDLQLLRGLRRGGAYQSLPSGHATSAFAAAEVLASEARRRWPEHAGAVQWAAYGSATLAALSRVYDDKHWASDVVLGAGIGILSARVLQRAHHADGWRGIDRWLIPRAIGAGPDGSVRLEWRP